MAKITGEEELSGVVSGDSYTINPLEADSIPTALNADNGQINVLESHNTSQGTSRLVAYVPELDLLMQSHFRGASLY